ncbi:hypothetical protein RMSM_02828 [Rhodopirellula maiorica SM1]|uniref:Secreted protein n=1 Tax=Rhodopirellula maiorica SM1 TaxID=1265738 RepID=M5RXY5_9BACT|nr:hypothetical protein RMSM_02828 [Rhodopirellula maiorica SM1]
MIAVVFRLVMASFFNAGEAVLDALFYSTSLPKATISKRIQAKKALSMGR